MKKAICIMLCFFMLMLNTVSMVAAFSTDSNPFAKLDALRNESLSNACSFNRFNTKPKIQNAAPVGVRYAVKFKDSASLSDIFECVKNYDYCLLSNSEQRMFSVTIEDLSVFRTAYGDMIEFIEEDEKLKLSATVDDPMAEGQWELESLNAYNGWEIATAKRDITVAVLDSGLYRQHEDFQNVPILAGYDTVTDSDGVNYDYNGHGTKVASIITAANNNGLGMASLAYGITLLPVRISDETGFIYSTDFIQALYYAADCGVDIINMSFGGYVYSATEEAAVEYASSKGCILISAAGNEGSNSEYAGMKSYPASYNSVISVGAINAAGEVCQFSQYNNSVDLVAPGEKLTVANDEGGYELENGTSFSAAYVSAAISLALSAIDDGYTFTADQFVTYIADLNGNTRTDAMGYGQIDLSTVLKNINTPMYSGIYNGGVYHRNVSIYYNRGTAKLDGEIFNSGDMVLISGNHELTIEDNNKTANIEFITDNIPLTYEYIENENSAKIVFDRGSATLDGAPYISGADITADGKHFFIITGPYGNSEHYEFECSFGAPKIFGIENGKRYTEGVYIRATETDSLLLNGNPIESGKAITENGNYTLVAKNDSKTITLYFTIAIPNVKTYDASVSNGQVAVDELYNAVYLYNNILSGIRVLDPKNLNTTLTFVKTEDGVIAHKLCGDNFVILHPNGVSTIPRSDMAAGKTDSLIYYAFEGKIYDAAIAEDCVYYISENTEGDYALRVKNVLNGVDELLCETGYNCNYVAYDNGTILVADENRTVFGYDTNGALQFKLTTHYDITDLIFSAGLLCTGKGVYSTIEKHELFSITRAETPIAFIDGVLITSNSIYSIETAQRIGAFETTLTDCLVGNDNKIYKYLSTLKLEVISNTSLFEESTAAEQLNAAACTKPFSAEVVQSSVFQQSVYFPTDLTVHDAVQINKTNEVCALSKAEQAICFFDKETLQIKAERNLRYMPESICTDGLKVYISFADKPFIYVSNGSEDFGRYVPCSRAYKKIKIYGDTLFALTATGDLYSIPANAVDTTAKILIKNQGVSCFDAYEDYVYAHISTVSFSFLYKINTNTGKVDATAKINSDCDKIIATSKGVISGKTVFDVDTLKKIYTFTEEIKYADNFYILTENGLYSNVSFKLLGTHYHDTTLPIFDAEYNYYSFYGNTLIKIKILGDSLNSLPEIQGIKHGDTLVGPVSPVYDYGIGYIDSERTESGTMIYNGGRHTFTICKAFGISYSYNFYIEAKISQISLNYNKATIAVNETASPAVSAYPYVTVNVDTVYSVNNDNAILYEDGTIMGVKPGECVITATTVDGLHSASYTVTVTESRIVFDSSYFREESDGVIGNIAPGTSIEALFTAVEKTHGTVVTTTKDGTEISVGVISTEMKILLHDINGNVIDERSMSVICDVDCDGYITANDYYVLQKISKQPEDISLAVKHAADTDGNGKVDVFDLLTIKEHLLGQQRLEEAKPMPEKTAKAVTRVVMPQHITPGTTVTVGIILEDAQNISCISGKITFDPIVYTVLGVNIPKETGDGFYSVEADGIYFFRSCKPEHESDVLLTVNFEISELYKPENSAFVSCNGIKLYDGAAAACTDTQFIPRYSDKAVADLLIFNLPDFEFDFDTNYYALDFSGDIYNVYIAAYPENSFIITGDTAFKDRTAVFSAVKIDAGVESKFDFLCTSNSEIAPPDSNIQNQADENTNLLSIKIANGVISPAFDRDILQYYIVCDNFDKVSVSAVAESEKSKVEIGALEKETNTITVCCTAENGSIKKYVLTLCKDSPTTVEKPEVPQKQNWPWLLIGGFVLVALIALVSYQVTLIIRSKKE